MSEAYPIRQKCVFHTLHDTSWLCVMIKRCGYSFRFNLWGYRHEFSWLIIVYSFKVKAFLAVIDFAERMMVSIHIDRSLWIRIGSGLQILEGTHVCTACLQGMVSGVLFPGKTKKPLKKGCGPAEPALSLSQVFTSLKGKEELTAWHVGGLAWWKQPRPSRDIMWTHMGSGGRGILLWSLCGFSRTWVWLLLLSDWWAGPWSPRGKEASMQPAAGFGRLVSKQGLRRTVRSYNSHFIVMVLGSQSTEGGADLF